MNTNLNPASNAAPQVKAPKPSVSKKENAAAAPTQKSSNTGHVTPNVKSAAKMTDKRTAKPIAKTKPAVRVGTKQDRVIAMLRQKEGASVASLMKMTDWQKHSVHGFFAGVVRKKLKLNLTSDEQNGKRVYRITTASASRNKGKPSAKRGR